jgi:hypothetical protein
MSDAKRIEVKVCNSTSESRILRSSDDGNDENIIKVGRGVAVVHNGRRIAVGNMKFLEDQMKLTSSNLVDTSDSRPGFSLLLNKKHHQYLKDAHLIGQTLQESSPVDML